MKIKCSGSFSGHLGKHRTPKCTLNQKCPLFPFVACIHKVCLFSASETFFGQGPFSSWLLYPDREKAVTGNEGDDGLLACAHLLLYWFSINLLPALSKPLTLPQGRVLLGRVPGCSACPPPGPQCPGAEYKAQHGLNAHGATSGTWPRPAKSSNHFTHPPPPPVLSNALKTGLNCNHILKYILAAQNGQLDVFMNRYCLSINS